MTARRGRGEVDDKALRLEARSRMAGDAALAQVRTVLLERHRELRKMSVMGGMSRADARELREIGAALDALDREASE